MNNLEILSNTEKLRKSNVKFIEEYIKCKDLSEAFKRGYFDTDNYEAICRGQTLVRNEKIYNSLKERLSDQELYDLEQQRRQIIGCRRCMNWIFNEDLNTQPEEMHGWRIIKNYPYCPACKKNCKSARG